MPLCLCGLKPIAMEHSHDIRVYYEDTDAGGIVYHADYIKYAERGRTEFLRALGLENRVLQDREGILFVVVHLEADFYKPAHLDDLLTVKTVVSELGNASFAMNQTIFCGDVRLFGMSVKLACVDLDKRVTRLTDAVRAAFEQTMGG